MAKDILLNNIFKNGDFNVDFSDEQHIEHVIVSEKGHFKHHPLLGVGIMHYAHAPMSPQIAAELNREIRLQLEVDTATNIRVNINQRTTQINATADYI
jgi:hypothetical protein